MGQRALHMAIRVGWGNEDQTIIYVQLIYGWRTSDIPQAGREIRDRCEQTGHSVSLLVNSADTDTHIQTGLITELTRARRSIPDNLTEAVVVGVGPTDKVLIISILQAVFPMFVRHIQFMDSMDEAMAYLSKSHNANS